MSNIEVRIIDEFPADMIGRVAELYRCAKWIDENSDTSFLEPALRGSALVAMAFAGSMIVGTARALSDGVSDAYIQDVVVDPEFRGMGIGSKLIDTLVVELQKSGVDWIGLVGEPGTENFYRKLNWTERPGYTLWQFIDKK